MKKNKVKVVFPVGYIKCACGETVTYTWLPKHIKTCPANREAARMLGAKGGAVKSEAKAKAARKNGKLGGRPKKKVSKK